MRRWLPSALAAAALALPALAAEPKTAVLEVSGMTCSLCPATVRKTLERSTGVLEARVDFKEKRAHATYDPAKVSPKALAKTLTDAGFPAKAVQP
jgi:periplasmic mercuric ion binding protein